MMRKKDKKILVHWYYSDGEWKEFVKLDKKKLKPAFIAEAAIIGMAGFSFLRFFLLKDWDFSLSMAMGFVLTYALLRYYTLPLFRKWRRGGTNEIIVEETMVIVNGRTTVFHANDIHLRKIDIIEIERVNILELSYEKKTAKGFNSAELRIPIPKGKLLEAIKLLDCLNLQNGLLFDFDRGRRMANGQ
jgi:hypothetical protein